MLPARTEEIPRLVKRLAGQRRQSVENAMSRLALAGGLAVEPLIDALDGDKERAIERAMQLLALIQDPRAREPLAAMLFDPRPRLRAAAALALGRFPHSRSVAALRRLLESEQVENVQVCTVQALVALHAAGQDDAVAPVLETLARPAQRRVRVAALELLPLLSAAQQRDILARLDGDAHRQVEQDARAVCERNGHEDGISTAQWVARLASRNYAEWNEAVRSLGARGQSAIAALLDEMHTRAHDPELCVRAGMALKAMGPRHAEAVAVALDRFDDPLPLLVLVEVLGALGRRSSIYRLKGLIDRLESRPGEADGFAVFDRVSARAHAELARIGSRVAAASLRRSLTDANRRVHQDLATALELIGQREDIGPLLDAWSREVDPTRERLARALRAILKREKIRRNSKFLMEMGGERRTALQAILSRSARARPVRRERVVAPG